MTTRAHLGTIQRATYASADDSRFPSTVTALSQRDCRPLNSSFGGEEGENAARDVHDAQNIELAGGGQ